MPERTPAWRAPAAMLACLPGIAVGAFVANAHGVDVDVFIPNVVGVVVGAALIAAAQARAAVFLRVMSWVCAAAVVATGFGPDVDGVHRWLSLGGVRVHPSIALAPWLVAAVAARPASAHALVPLLCVMGVHVAQPDAGQATVVAVGGVAAIVAGGVTVVRAAVAAVVVALGVAAWARPDPLRPVAHVEEILTLAAARPSTALAALLAVAALALPLVAAARTTSAARALLAMGAAAFLVPVVGAFPVPVVGGGLSGVVGFASALAALAALESVEAGAIVPACAPSSPPLRSAS